MYTRRLTEDRRASDEIVVPTGQLFIEALPGAHPLLEDFKLEHRRQDQAERERSPANGHRAAILYSASPDSLVRSTT